MNNILILGATSDIAQAIAKRYAAEGCNLMLGALEADELDAVVQDLKGNYQVNIDSFAFDATDFQSHRKFYDALPVKPDVVISVFGYLVGDKISRADFNEAHRIIDVNFLGSASILGIIANDFEERGYGSIVGVSSVAGERGRQGGYIYASTKAGLTAFLSGMRNRLSRCGVHVMTVKAGFCRTKMTKDVNFPARLTSTPEQVAEAVFTGVKKRKSDIYTLGIWRWIMLVIRHIPEPLWKKIAYSRIRY